MYANCVWCIREFITSLDYIPVASKQNFSQWWQQTEGADEKADIKEEDSNIDGI